MKNTETHQLSPNPSVQVIYGTLVCMCGHCALRAFVRRVVEHVDGIGKASLGGRHCCTTVRRELQQQAVWPTHPSWHLSSLWPPSAAPGIPSRTWRAPGAGMRSSHEAETPANEDARLVLGLLICKLPVYRAFNLARLLQELLQRAEGQFRIGVRGWLGGERNYRSSCTGETLLESGVRSQVRSGWRQDIQRARR